MKFFRGLGITTEAPICFFFAVGATNAETSTPPETTTEEYELCPDFECPNSDDEGGLFSVFFKHDIQISS